MALAGGRAGWVSTGLTALGVGFGVALLLVAVSLPHATNARYQREDARQPTYAEAPASATTILVEEVQTEFRDRSIKGLLVQPEGPQPPRPPGVAALPGPGELVVSPALARLLASPGGALLRERLHYPIVGTIGDEGLASPSELFFYLGADDIAAPGDDPAALDSTRATGFGGGPSEIRIPGPLLALIVVVVVVVLLAPVGVFAAAATRFGSEARDRRLAGVRLVGADVRMTRRIAAGEALVGSGFGLLVGAGLFLIGRSFVDRLSIMDVSAFPADLQPDPALTALLIVAVPATAVLVTMVAMRRVLVEPLGVTRRAGDVRRRLWWRLLLPVAGVLVLVPLFGDLKPTSGAPPGSVNALQVGLGLGLILIGVAVLLPWLVQVAIRRLRGGPVAWQLATRRLQLDATTATRAVVGIAVAVAGAIGVQTVLASTLATDQADRGQDPHRADVTVFHDPDTLGEMNALDESLRTTPGVTTVYTALYLSATDVATGTQGFTVMVAACATLQEFALVEPCMDGDVFVIPDPLNPSPTPGDRLALQTLGDEEPLEWTMPASTRTVPATDSRLGSLAPRILATPSTLPPMTSIPGWSWASSWVWLDPAQADAVEHVRTTVWRASPTYATYFSGTEAEQMATAGRALLPGAAAMLVIIGASLLITQLDQLRERRRVLAGLIAFGTRRRTLAWSVLWQAVIPVGLGLLLAVGAGLTLAWAVLSIAGEAKVVDWRAIGVMTGVAAFVVVGTTVLSLPVLWRLMRADGLRTE